MSAAFERRMARMERERAAEDTYVILPTLPGEDDAPERELTPEEWQARHCSPEDCR